LDGGFNDSNIVGMAIDFAFVMFIKIGTIEDGLPLSIVILEA
jgi:hypothetical protein